MLLDVFKVKPLSKTYGIFYSCPQLQPYIFSQSSLAIALRLMWYFEFNFLKHVLRPLHSVPLFHTYVFELMFVCFVSEHKNASYVKPPKEMHLTASH